MEYIKAPESTVVVRFQDCDPLGHLNNSRYIDYMINVREDHLIGHYDFNIFKMTRELGITWVVGHHELAYLKPVFVMEKVLIQTRLINYTEKYVQAEMVMYDLHKTHIKAVLWSKFFHFDVKSQKSRAHSEEHLSLFEKLLDSVAHEKVEERARHLATELKMVHAAEKVL